MDAPPDPTQWTVVPDPLLPSDQATPPTTSFPVAVLGFDGALHCVWVNANSQLYYSKYIVGGDNTWQAQQPVSLNEIPEQATQAASLAVYRGKIHAVFPDENNNLIHFQLSNGLNPVWGKRVGLAVATTDPISLTEFGGFLYCLFRNPTGPSGSNLCMTSYSKASGWAKPVAVTTVVPSFGPVALFELNGLLRMLFVDDSNPSTIRYYSYNTQNSTWTPVGLPSGTPTSLAPGSGVSAHCVYNLAFVACRTATTMNTLRLEGHYWKQPQTIAAPIASTGTSPAITILGNTVYCFWSDTTSSQIRCMSRSALDSMPPIDRWMSAIGDDRQISSLTVPGTHDAAAVSDVPMVGCQSMSITRQLEAGIRYFDIRGGFRSQIFGTPQLIVFHGVYPIGTPLLDIFQEMYNFLRRPANKFECLVVQIKQDYGVGDINLEEQFATGIQTLIGQAAVGQWRVASTNPTLGDLRGKIQLVRRFRVPLKLADFGISVNLGWTDNSPFVQLQNTTVLIRVQDRWNLDSLNDIPNKLQLITAHFDAAVAEQNMDVWYLNFASATVPTVLGQARDVALGMTVEDTDVIGHTLVRVGINKDLSTYFNSAVPMKRYGFILMDFPGDPAELLVAIVRMNFPS